MITSTSKKPANTAVKRVYKLGAVKSLMGPIGVVVYSRLTCRAIYRARRRGIAGL